MDRELTLHHQLELLRRESCDSVSDYLRKYMIICDDLATIGKPLSRVGSRFRCSMVLGLTVRCLPL